MKHPIKFLMTFILLLVVLAGCSAAPPETQTPTQPGDNQPADSGSNAGSGQTPAEQSDAEPTPYDAASQRAPEAVHIAAPGSGSGVISPLVVEGIADSALGSEVTVQLFQMSDSGNPYDTLLTQENVTIQPQMGTTGPFRVELAFTPQQSNDVGWVAVSFSDPVSGALLHVATSQVTLLSSGEAQIAIPESSGETIEIQSPTAGQTVSGGELAVSGYSEYFFEANLGVMLCAVEGDTSGAPQAVCGTSTQTISTGYLMIASPDMGLPGPFEGSLHYQVDEETSARLVVYALSPRDGSILHLSSAAVTLVP